MALHSAKYDDRECGRVLQRISQMHASPPRRRTNLPRPPIRLLHAKVLSEALSQPNERGNRNHKRDPERASAIPVRRPGGRVLRGEKHAQRDEQVAEHLRVTGERIGEQDVAELPVLRLRDPANRYALQRREGPGAAIAAHEGQWYHETHD